MTVSRGSNLRGIVIETSAPEFDATVPATTGIGATLESRALCQVRGRESVDVLPSGRGEISRALSRLDLVWVLSSAVRDTRRVTLRQGVRRPRLARAAQ